MKFSLDKEKAFNLAKQLGIKISFDNDNPGVIITSNEKSTEYTLEQFFPELTGNTNFVSKDRDVFESEAPLKNTSPIIIPNNQTIISSSNIPIQAA